jgi:hypothetical protein
LGVDLKAILVGGIVSLEDLRDKLIVIDASNILHQFLGTISARSLDVNMLKEGSKIDLDAIGIDKLLGRGSIQTTLKISFS